MSTKNDPRLLAASGQPGHQVFLRKVHWVAGRRRTGATAMTTPRRSGCLIGRGAFAALPDAVRVEEMENVTEELCAIPN